jgi:hypothetical protein
VIPGCSSWRLLCLVGWCVDSQYGALLDLLGLLPSVPARSGCTSIKYNVGREEDPQREEEVGDTKQIDLQREGTRNSVARYLPCTRARGAVLKKEEGATYNTTPSSIHH